MNKYLKLILILSIIITLGMIVRGEWVSTLDNGLISYYRFQSTGSSVIDYTNFNNGENIGATRGVNGIIGRAFNFDGVNDAVNISNTNGIYGSGNLSISIWFNLNSSGTASQSVLIDRRQAPGDATSTFYIVFSNVNSRVEFHTTNQSGTEVSSITPTNSVTLNNTWYNVVATYTNETGVMKLYLNGTLIDTDTNKGGLINPNSIYMFVGGRRGLDNLFNGTIDELGIWNKVLNNTEVSEIWNNGLGSSPPTPIEVTLGIPLDNFQSSDEIVKFNATITPSSSTNLTNATIYIWNSSNSELNVTTNEMDSNILNLTEFNITGLQLDVLSWNIFVCGVNSSNDPSCSFADANRTLNYGYTINSQIYPNSTTQGATEFFEINISVVPGYNINTANLLLNNTEYSGSINQIIENNYSITKSVSIDDVFSATSIQFNWSIDYTSGFEFGTPPQSLPVSIISLDNCGSQPILMINYSMKDEDSRSYLTGDDNVTIDVLAKIYKLGTNTLVSQYNRTYNVVNSTNPAQVCIAGETLNDTSFSLDVETRYNSENHEPEYYNIQNYTLTNNTIPILSTLYDLITTNSQEFLITIKDSNYIPLEDSIVEITRQYLGIGQYLLVEAPKTDGDGRAVGHFVLNDEIYTIRIRKNNVLLGTFDNVRAFCSNIATGDCRINLNLVESTINPTDYSTINNISFSAEYDEPTRIYTLNFYTTDGISRLVSLNGTLFDNYQNISVCSNQLTASSGSLTCTIPSGYENSTIIMKGYGAGDLLFTDIFDADYSKSDLLPDSRYILAFLLIITLPLLAITSGVGTLIMFLVGLVFAGVVSLIDVGGFVGITSAILWFIVAIVILIWKVNKNENG